MTSLSLKVENDKCDQLVVMRDIWKQTYHTLMNCKKYAPFYMQEEIDKLDQWISQTMAGYLSDDKCHKKPGGNDV